MRKHVIPIAAAALIALAGPAAGKVLRLNTPAAPLTIARIEREAPMAERAAWVAYLRRSEALRQRDRDSLPKELRPGETAPPAPIAVTPEHYNMPLDRDAEWYGGAEARRIADTIVSFQTPAGGWSKNMDRSRPRRLPGQRYANDAETMDPDRANFDAPEDRFWTFVGTFDNDATWNEMQFLRRVSERFPGREGDAYRQSLVRGVRYILAAQYPNGGWPQIYPLEGGFHDGITFNDDAMAHAIAMMRLVATDPAFRFVPRDMRQGAARAVERGLALIVRAQVVRDGAPMGWPQQADALTLQPISARNYEPRSISSAETADLLLFLLTPPAPSPAMRRAIDGAARWLERVAVRDVAWTGKGTPEGRKLIRQPGGGPLWARNYDLTTGAPIFGDKDKTIHDDVNDISIGRRNGYNWWVTTPAEALTAYATWKRRAD